jgi:hypothetical protein
VPNKEKIQKWQKALESGEYQQGLGTLYDKETNSYCCLGVAAKLENIQTTTQSYFKIEEIYGLTIDDTNKFIKLNDEERKTFKEIAEFIGENYVN